MKLTANSSSETLEARRQWDYVFKVLKENTDTPTKPSFRNKCEIKTKLTEFSASRLALQEILKRILQEEMKLDSNLNSHEEIMNIDTHNYVFFVCNFFSYLI